MINHIINMKQGSRITQPICNLEDTQPVTLVLYENKNGVMNEITITAKEENITKLDGVSYITFTYDDLKEHLDKDLLFAFLFSNTMLFVLSFYTQ